MKYSRDELGWVLKMAKRHPRVKIVAEIAALAGAAVEVVDAANGWPAVLEVKTGTGCVRVHAYVGRFSTQGFRGRDAVERRFQNPSSSSAEVEPPRGTLPLLLGLWSEEGAPVLAAFDAQKRIGKETRHSHFSMLWALRQAAQLWWSEQVSSTGECITYFRPELLATYVSMRASTVHLNSLDVIRTVEASGVEPDATPLPVAERARRATYSLVRRAVFSKQVVEAYDAECAMCGLDFGLVQGAHILPVAAAGSVDEVRNGIALCANHHLAFDRHMVRIDPDRLTLIASSELMRLGGRNEVCAAFVATTRKMLRVPSKASDRPDPLMLRRRYEFFEIEV